MHRTLSPELSKETLNRFSCEFVKIVPLPKGTSVLIMREYGKNHTISVNSDKPGKRMYEAKPFVTYFRCRNTEVVYFSPRRNRDV